MKILNSLILSNDMLFKLRPHYGRSTVLQCAALLCMKINIFLLRDFICSLTSIIQLN